MKYMTTTLDPPEQRVLLNNIDWELYEALLMAHRDSSVPRFTYDDGCLEIMSPSADHEQIKDAVVQLVNIFAEENAINIKGFGSTTFRRKDLSKGFEPDACFYSTNLRKVQGKRELDLQYDPPPDLAIEIDITRSSLDKLSIFEKVGVPELWRFHNGVWRIFKLQPEGYVEQSESSVLQGLAAGTISALIEQSLTLEPLAWIRCVREQV